MAKPATRVLVAEDEPNILESVTFILERAGYEVLSAPDGQVAMDTLSFDPPHLAILDVMMPRLNGFEILKRVRGAPHLKTLPVIILTAKGQAKDRELAEQMGVSAFVTKPFSNAELLQTVAELTQP